MATEDDAALKMLARAIARLEELLERLPVDVARDLRARIATLRTVVLEKRPPALVLVGRRGAGKSSLVNALFGARVADLGHVTAQTGRGRWYDYQRDGGAMSILDTRGVQEGSPPAEADRAATAVESIAVELRAKLPDLVVFVAKATEVDAAIDRDLDALERVYDELRRAHRSEPPLLAVVTHCDVLEPKGTRLHLSATEPREDVDEKLQHVAEAESAVASQIEKRNLLRGRLASTLGISVYMSWRADGTLRADERWRVGDLAMALFHHLPDASRAELARVTRTKAVQQELAVALTKATAAVCAGIAAAPIPLADIVPLTTMQIGLVAAIAWIAGRSIDRRAAAEFIAGLGANIGLAFVLREAVRAALKIIAPAGGPILSATVAFSGTMAIGAAARGYFIQGVSMPDARRIFRRNRERPDAAGSRERSDPPSPGRRADPASPGERTDAASRAAGVDSEDREAP
ncbi:MAG TPA: GTPase [Polyangiaceae bacterium]|nr:GTPase [Polyangiaceae bacterium]